MSRFKKLVSCLINSFTKSLWSYPDLGWPSRQKGGLFRPIGLQIAQFDAPIPPWCKELQQIAGETMDFRLLPSLIAEFEL